MKDVIWSVGVLTLGGLFVRRRVITGEGHAVNYLPPSLLPDDGDKEAFFCA